MKKIFTYYLKPYYLRMVLGFSIKFTGTIMDLLLPWALAHTIDVVVPAGRKGEILLWGLFMIGCSLVAAAFNVLANRMASRVASNAMFSKRTQARTGSRAMVMAIPPMRSIGARTPNR